MNDSQRDYNERINPALVTKLLSEAVPTMKDVDFKFLEVRKGYCKSILPLNHKSSNQHGTHQALIMGMSGDYTGGLALASVIAHEPILGIHEITPETGMSLWLIQCDMKYLKPSTDDIIVEASVSENLWDTINKRYHIGQTVLHEVSVTFKDLRNIDIAKGTFRYYCKKKNALAAVSKDKSINMMFEHILKTSAKLIAQLRSVESVKSRPLFIDNISTKVAGKQGKVIADRFMKLLPELQNMVASRTFHLDEALKAHASKIKNVIFIGVGLDFRMYLNQTVFKDMTIFELDLAEMLSERIQLEALLEIKSKDFQTPIKINCNFIAESIAEKLLAGGFNPEEPTFYIFEGCSMYFSEKENQKIIMEISGLLKQNTDSLLWMDMVDSRVIKNTESLPKEIKSFLSNMAKLGEPFVYGFDESSELLNTAHLNIIERSFTNNCMEIEPSAVYSLYSFNILRYKH
jgi:methyltransferase (TIGR00027 family)